MRMARAPAGGPGTSGFDDADAAPMPGAFWLVVVGSGVLVGVLSVAFHVGLDAVLAGRERLTAWAMTLGPPGVLVPVVGCAAAVALAVWMAGRLAPLAAGSGIQHVEGVERGLLRLWPLSVVWVKFVGGIIGIGGGLVLGREGPTVQMGASLAEHVGARWGLPDAARRALVAVGAGAGLTGAFNAPLAGTLFVVEELRCPVRPAIYLGTLLASAIADLAVRFWLGPVAELQIRGEVPPPLVILVPVVLLGALGGLVGVVFNAAVLAMLAVVDGWKRRLPAWMVGLAMGAVLGGVAWFVPALPGGGVTFAARIVDGSLTPGAALWLLPLSFALTIASYAVGAPGGIF